jgi:hypothetical protein
VAPIQPHIQWVAGAVSSHVRDVTSERKAVFTLMLGPVSVRLPEGVFPLRFVPKFLMHTSYRMFVVLLNVTTLIVTRRTVK